MTPDRLYAADLFLTDERIAKIAEEKSKLSEFVETLNDDVTRDYQLEISPTEEIRETMLKSLLGIELTGFDYQRVDKDAGYEPVPRVYGLNSSAALEGFVMGSLRTKTFNDPVDRARRNACREFVF
jgi:hypothetical protein